MWWQLDGRLHPVQHRGALHDAVSYDGDHGITGQQVAVRFYMERQ
jgi:hypothetical protein